MHMKSQYDFGKGAEPSTHRVARLKPFAVNQRLKGLTVTSISRKKPGAGCRMGKESNLAVLAGSGNFSLVESIAERLGMGLCRCAVTRFPDSELHVELHDSVRACDLYVVQPTGHPVDGHLMELLLLA